jgi:hypothetical protein
MLCVDRITIGGLMLMVILVPYQWLLQERKKVEACRSLHK